MSELSLVKRGGAEGAKIVEGTTRKTLDWNTMVSSLSVNLGGVPQALTFKMISGQTYNFGVLNPTAGGVYQFSGWKITITATGFTGASGVYSGTTADFDYLAVM